MRCELIKKRREIISDTVRRPRALEPLLLSSNTQCSNNKSLINVPPTVSSAPAASPPAEREGAVGSVQRPGGQDGGGAAPAALAEPADCSQSGTGRARQQPGRGGCCRHPQGSQHKFVCRLFVFGSTAPKIPRGSLWEVLTKHISISARHLGPSSVDALQVIMRLIQSAVAEVKAIQPSAAQDMLALLPPGKHRSLPELEAGSGGQGGQGGSALLPAQEKLHQEGKAALRTLSSTRESLQEAMERELQEQRELRAQCRAFFRSVGPPLTANALHNTRLFTFCLFSFVALAQLLVLVPVVSVRRRPSQNEAGVSEVSLCHGPLPGAASRCLQSQNSLSAGSKEEGERRENGE